MTKAYREEGQERPFHNEAYNDTMKAKEQEAYYKSFGQTVPEEPKTIEQAKEHLQDVERNRYKNG